MTIDNLPRLLQDAIKSNEYDIDVITKHLKLPWLKLDLDFGLDENDHDQLMSQEDWRTKWNFNCSRRLFTKTSRVLFFKAI